MNDNSNAYMNTMDLGESNRMNLIEYIVTKRLNNLDYITRVHEGSVCWMNTVKLSQRDIENFYHPQTLEKRVQHWFYLGISLAPLLQLPNGRRFIRACAQLTEEYEYNFSNVAVQKMKILKTLTTAKHEENEENEDAPIKPVINKVGGVVVYEFLRTPNIPCALDYNQVIFSLCHLLKFLYRKLMDESSASPVLSESIIKLDGRLKHHFFGQISRDLNAIALYITKQQTSSLDSLFASWSSPVQSPAMAILSSGTGDDNDNSSSNSPSSSSSTSTTTTSSGSSSPSPSSPSVGATTTTTTTTNSNARSGSGTGGTLSSSARLSAITPRRKQSNTTTAASSSPIANNDTMFGGAS